MEKLIRSISRFLIIALFIFVVLNWSKILEYGTYFTWRGLVFTILIASIIVEASSLWLYKKHKTHLNGWLYLPIVFMLYYDVIGDAFYFYRDFSWYDQVAHFMGGFWIMLFIWQLLRQSKICLGLKGKLLLALTSTWALGTIYEIEEYIEDIIYGSNRLGDAFDTVNDILLNNLGSLLMLFIIALIVTMYKKRKNVRRNNPST